MHRNQLWAAVLLFFLFTSLYAQPRGYRPILRNDLNTSAYDWNALHTKWVNMRAIMMVALDASHFYQDEESMQHVGDMSHYDRWDVRGLRVGAAGTFNFDEPWTYLVSGAANSLMKDFNAQEDERYSLLDCVVAIPLWGEFGRMQIGKMKEPISMERTMGMVFEQVMERPAHLDALLPSRNIGIGFSDLLFDQRMKWRVGIFNDWLDPGEPDFSESNYQLIGRVTAVLYEDQANERLLHLGGAYRYEKVREGKLRYDVGPEFYFSGPWLDTGSFSADESQTFNAELTYLDGPLWFASEYTATWVDSPEYGKLFFSGYHVVANYFLTGEHRGYNKQRGTVRRINPVLDFTNGGWGAVEVSARYSYLDLSDGKIQGGVMQTTSLGVIWHPKRSSQLHLQWSRIDLKRKSMIADGPGRSSTDILQARWVLVID
jgi:phosphate-selective porin OprO/OprP